MLPAHETPVPPFFRPCAIPCEACHGVEPASEFAALDVTPEQLFGHDAPDETAAHIAELLDGQNPRVKRQAGRIIRVLVEE